MAICYEGPDGAQTIDALERKSPRQDKAADQAALLPNAGHHQR
jgi:hypothetical protein